MGNDTIKSTLQKISALAEGSSSAGERQAATQKLNDLLDKYGLSLADVLEREELFECEFSYKDEHERQLLFNLFANVRDTTKIEWLHAKNSRAKRIYFELTRAEYAEMSSLYGIYRAALKDELEIFISAFMHKHALFSTSGSSEPKPLTPERIERIKKIQSMMSGMTQVDVPSNAPQIKPPPPSYTAA